jgi:hypothetical protein
MAVPPVDAVGAGVLQALSTNDKTTIRETMINIDLVRILFSFGMIETVKLLLNYFHNEKVSFQ